MSIKTNDDAKYGNANGPAIHGWNNKRHNTAIFQCCSTCIYLL